MHMLRRFALLLPLVLACRQPSTQTPPKKTEPTPCVRTALPPVDVLGDGTCSRPCRADPPSTSTCVAGRCHTTLVQSGVDVRDLAVDPLGVYWGGSENSAPHVHQIPLSGGTPGVIAAPQIRGSGDPPISSLVARDGLLYIGFKEGVVAAPSEGGSLTTILDVGIPQSLGLQLMTMGPSEIYFLAKEKPMDGFILSGIVVKAPILGGTPVTLFVPPQSPISQSGPNTVPEPVHMAADSQNIYWSEAIFGQETSVIRRVPIAGGDMSTLATVQVPGPPLSTDADAVYWTDAVAGTVMKASTDGSTVTTLASGQTHPSLILSDGEWLYWADDACPGEDNGAILKMPLAGGPIEVIASGISVNNDGAFAVQENSLYWNSKDGIMKISPR